MLKNSEVVLFLSKLVRPENLDPTTYNHTNYMRYQYYSFIVMIYIVIRQISQIIFYCCFEDLFRKPGYSQ